MPVVGGVLKRVAQRREVAVVERVVQRALLVLEAHVFLELALLALDLGDPIDEHERLGRQPHTAAMIIDRGEGLPQDRTDGTDGKLEALLAVEDGTLLRDPRNIPNAVIKNAFYNSTRRARVAVANV